MTDLSRIKTLAGLTESVSIDENDRASTADEIAANNSWQWVSNDIDRNAHGAAIWGLFMQYETDELMRVHRQFKREERRDRGDDE